MAKIADLVSRNGVAQDTDGSGANTWVGYVASPVPASVNDDLYVTIPDMSGDRPWGPCNWGGTVTPNLGDQCLVVFDNRQQIWAIFGIGDALSDTLGIYFGAWGTADISVTNTDLAWVSGEAINTYLPVSMIGGVGTLRSIAAPTAGAGSRLLLFNWSGHPLTIKQNIDPSPGRPLWLQSLADEVLGKDACIELVYDGYYWEEINITLGSDRSSVVSSVFGRTGAVVAQTGDYGVAQITGAESSAHAAATYETISHASSTYETAAHAASTYSTPASVGTAIAANGPKITSSAMSGGPPVSPNDGDIWIATGVDAANGTVWQFRYNAGSASPYKWEFIGGAPIFTSYPYPGGLSLGASTYVAITNLAITVPRAGDYIFDGHGQINAGSAAGSFEFILALSQNSTTTPLATDPYFGYPEFTGVSGANSASIRGMRKFTGAALNDVFRLLAWCNGTGANSVGMGHFSCIPARIS